MALAIFFSQFCPVRGRFLTGFSTGLRGPKPRGYPRGSTGSYLWLKRDPIRDPNRQSGTKHCQEKTPNRPNWARKIAPGPILGPIGAKKWPRDPIQTRFGPKMGRKPENGQKLARIGAGLESRGGAKNDPFSAKPLIFGKNGHVQSPSFFCQKTAIWRKHGYLPRNRKKRAKIAFFGHFFAFFGIFWGGPPNWQKLQFSAIFSHFLAFRGPKLAKIDPRIAFLAIFWVPPMQSEANPTRFGGFRNLRGKKSLRFGPPANRKPYRLQDDYKSVALLPFTWENLLQIWASLAISAATLLICHVLDQVQLVLMQKLVPHFFQNWTTWDN